MTELVIHIIDDDDAMRDSLDYLLDAAAMATRMAYVVGDAVFVGDTLFMPDYGTARCDFPGGDAATRLVGSRLSPRMAGSPPAPPGPRMSTRSTPRASAVVIFCCKSYARRRRFSTASVEEP